MCLPKNTVEIVGSRLETKNFLSRRTNFTWYRHRESELISCFSEDGSVVYCRDISRMIRWYNVHYNAPGSRLCIASCKSVSGVCISVKGMSVRRLPLHLVST
jgi:hypothetical protein